MEHKLNLRKYFVSIFQQVQQKMLNDNNSTSVNRNETDVWTDMKNNKQAKISFKLHLINNFLDKAAEHSFNLKIQSFKFNLKIVIHKNEDNALQDCTFKSYLQTLVQVFFALSSHRRKSQDKINDIVDLCKEIKQKKGSMLLVRKNEIFFK